MSLKRGDVCIAIVIAITVLTSPASIPLCAATQPSYIELVYTFGSQVLTMNVSHSVANNKTHFIETIEIQKNGLSLLNRSYANQSYKWGLYDTFSIASAIGDNLTVTGFCSRGDSLTAWLIVTSSTATNPPSGTTTTTEPTTSTDSPNALLNAGPVVAMGVGVLIFFLLFFLWLKPEYAPDALKQLGSKTRTGVTWLGEKLRGVFAWLKTGLSSLIQRIKNKSP